MLHACFYTICLLFRYTSWHFYAFSGTNLLTSCHSASSLFSAVFRFWKVIKEILSELDESKTQPPIFSTQTRSQKGKSEGGPQPPHHVPVRPRGGGTTTWCGPFGRLQPAYFRLYIAPDAKTLNEWASIHKKFRSSAAIEDKFWGIEISVLAPCRDGELPLEPSPSTPRPSSSLLLTPMMRRE